MTDYLTEQEQIELLKNWIKQYAGVILLGIALAVTGMWAWRYWQERQTNIVYHASSVYDEMLMKHAQNNASETTIQANKLFRHYRQTIYGQLAAFTLAREAVAKKDYKEVEKQLRWVLEKSHVAAFRQIARLRLARLFIAEQRPEEALALLQKVEEKSFEGLIDEVKGDAYLKMKNTTMARQSYQKALDELPNAEVMRPLLQMKYDNLA